MIPGRTIPESLAEYQERMYDEAARLRDLLNQKGPGIATIESVAMLIEALGDLAFVIAKEFERRDEREDWRG